MKILSIVGYFCLTGFVLSGCQFDGAGLASEPAAASEPVRQKAVRERQRLTPGDTSDGEVELDRTHVEGDDVGTRPSGNEAAPVEEGTVSSHAEPVDADDEPCILIREPTSDEPWEPLNAGDTAETPKKYRQALPPYQSLPAEQVVPEKKLRES
jgi:hypothetical protein